MKKTFTFLLTLLLTLFIVASAFAQPAVTLTSQTVSAANLPQGTTNNPVYIVKMSVSNQAATVSNVQINLGGSYDANDLTVLRVYFNATAPTVAGATNLNAVVPNSAGPHTYNIGISQTVAAGTAGYFIFVVDLASNATKAHTIKVNGATNPVVFTYSVVPTLTNSQTNAAGTQTIQAASVTVSSSAVGAATIPQGSTDQIVYIAHMTVATQNVTVTNVQVPLAGTHDANDLTVLRVYFNPTAPSLTGAINLNAVVPNSAAPHTYNIGVNQAISAGSGGYFIVVVDVSPTATDAKTVSVNGSSAPLVFGFTTAPTITNSQTNASGTLTIQAANVTVGSSPVAASIVPQGSTDQVVYIAPVSVTTQDVTVNNVQVTLGGTHDANDLTVLRVYFNPTAPSLTGAINLNAVVPNSAAPHTYNIGVNQAMAAGSSGYFIVVVDVSSTASDAKTVLVNGLANPIALGFTTAPNITSNQTNVAGTQTIQAADVTIMSSAVPASNISQGSSNNLVYIAQLNVATQDVLINNIQVPLSGTYGANDLTVLRVYFNPTAPSLTGAVNLNAVVPSSDAPSTYNIGVNQAMAAGSSGYFIVVVDVDPVATIGKTVKVDGSNDPLVFGFTTAPNITDSQGDVAGTQTITVALPVVFTQFSAKATESGVAVNWKTATEKNSSYFDVEHSVDGRQFTSIGKVQGKGDSQAEQAYEFLHKTPQQGANFYRVKQVDRDGQFTYTNIVQVVTTDKGQLVVTVKGNPVKSTLQYTLSTAANGRFIIQVLDAAGKAVVNKAEQVSKGENNLQINTSQLAKGVYFLSVTDEGSNLRSLQRVFIER